MKKLKIVCSSNMPFAKEAFETIGETVVLEGRRIAASDVRDADILAIRSTTCVDQNLLEGSAVKFVGTATIGTDHMDLEYLERKGIHWMSSPGCNAMSVSEYVTAALLTLAAEENIRLEGRTLGVIGVGNVGRRIVEKAEALGMRVLQNDPPRQRAEDSHGRKFVSLEQVLRESDVISLHVPLTKEGRDATFHMANAEFFEAARENLVFLNAARGAVADTDALLAAIRRGKVGRTVVDTWEEEPDIRTDLLQKVDIGTPHIAGHSFEGKVNGTVMVYQDLCRFLRIEPEWDVEPLLPPAEVSELSADPSDHETEEQLLHDIVRRVYDIKADDRRLREGVARKSIPVAEHFDGLRRNYPVRREFRFTNLTLRNASDSLTRKVENLGFSVS